MHRFETIRQLESSARTYASSFEAVFESGAGALLRDQSGREIIDCLSCAGALPLGHNHPEVNDAIRRFFRSGHVQQALDLSTPAKFEFVKTLFETLPDDWARRAKIQFCSPSGSDAVEAAMKLTRFATGRQTIVAFSGAYHGMTRGALAAMGNLGVKSGLGLGAGDVHFAPYPYRFRCPFGTDGTETDALSIQYLRNLLADPESGVSKPAAVVVEVVQGEGGCIPVSDAWLRALRQLTRAHEIALIIDEVQTGFGRTGSMFAFERAGIRPDVLVLSKAIGGGFPLAVVVYDEVLDVWPRGKHAGTFRGNQIAMVAGKATIEILRRDRLDAHAAQMGALLVDGLREIARAHPEFGDVRGRGLMVGVEIVDPSSDGAPQDGELARAIKLEAFRNGLLVETGGRHGAVLRLLPPLIVNRADISAILERLDASIAQAKRGRGPRGGANHRSDERDGEAARPVAQGRSALPQAEPVKREAERRRGLLKPAFLLLWLGETALDFGSALMSFALVAWIFQKTGSAERFSFAVLSAAIPALLLTPVAGALADRFDRRWVIAGCDVAMAIMIGALAWLLFRGALAPGHLYFFNATSAAIGCIRMPAYRAAVTAIVPRERLTQASGFTGTSQALLRIAAPLIAGYVLADYGLKGIVGLDMLMIAAGSAAIFAALLRAAHAIRGVVGAVDASLIEGVSASFAAAVRYFKSVPMFQGLAAYNMLQESLLLLSSVMLTPLVLSTHSSSTLGLILTYGALGGLAGSLLLLVLRIEARLMSLALFADAVLAMLIALVGFSRSPAAWCAFVFLAYFASSASSACTSALWARKTPREMRGSIFALNTSMNLAAMSIVVLVGGVLCQRLFEPALADGGAWAPTVGAWLGTGKGRGIGLLLVLCGAAGCVASLLALTCTRLRHLDALVPDQTHDDARDLLRNGVAVT